MNREAALVVFSGGQDSTTCLFWAKRNFKKVYALSFLYGQTTDLDYFRFKKIGCNEAHIKKNAQQHKGYRYFFFHNSCFLRGVLEYTTAIHGIIRLFFLIRMQRYALF